MAAASHTGRAVRRQAPELSLERIVETAVAVLDVHGLEGMSLRKVAGELGAGVNSLYWYVKSKDELLDLVADQVLARLEMPPQTGDWRNDCRTAMGSLRELLLSHPHALSLIVTRPPIGPQALQRSEWLLEVLEAAGFRGRGLLDAHATLLTYTLGKVTQEVAWYQRTPATEGAAPSGCALEPAQMVEAYRDLVDPEAFPRVSSLIHLMANNDRDGEFLAGIDVILNGLQPSDG